MSQAFFTDPLGSWPSDVQDISLECSTFSASPNSYIIVYNEEFVIKNLLKPNSVDVDNERLGREVDMTLLAGNPGCAIPIIGRYFSHGMIMGFITRFGKCITQGPRDDIRPEYHDHRLSVIQQFCALLDRLHSKGIIHGDVKPSNLVFDAADNLRFIDFAEAVLESEPPCRHASTTRYVSPSSLKTRSPLTRADDLYAAGMTIWHIYTGHLPFENIEEDDVDLLIEEGLRPDLSLIDDEGVRALISEYLDGGE
ncbi:kinase-like domain-containing protein [Cantharellus anzutake]|uniref:kinase-like domain-containing protein n=1 Tax=Cantharellus anzutake TaxID=1750568 RepID=UPI001906748C|nr:kinase-like domain-containing protein [Cantharellus anzutake]KAF8331860.1 kinase-like domain-containing protein [Cantharellus anzutake]